MVLFLNCARIDWHPRGSCFGRWTCYILIAIQRVFWVCPNNFLASFLSKIRTSFCSTSILLLGFKINLVCRMWGTTVKNWVCRPCSVLWIHVTQKRLNEASNQCFNVYMCSSFPHPTPQFIDFITCTNCLKNKIMWFAFWQADKQITLSLRKHWTELAF